MQIKTVAINSINFDVNNARKHSDKNLQAIVASLTKFGQRKPIVVHNGIVIAGNGTLEAAKSLGWTEIVVTEVPNDWDINTAKAYALADNRSAELAEWDESILVKTLMDLQDDDWSLEDLGFSDRAQLDEESKSEDTSPQNIGERYEVVIECADENEQTSLLLRLSQEGLKVKALVL